MALRPQAAYLHVRRGTAHRGTISYMESRKKIKLYVKIEDLLILLISSILFFILRVGGGTWYTQQFQKLFLWGFESPLTQKGE